MDFLCFFFPMDDLQKFWQPGGSDSLWWRWRRSHMLCVPSKTLQKHACWYKFIFISILILIQLYPIPHGRPNSHQPFNFPRQQMWREWSMNLKLTNHSEGIKRSWSFKEILFLFLFVLLQIQGLTLAGSLTKIRLSNSCHDCAQSVTFYFIFIKQISLREE